MIRIKFSLKKTPGICIAPVATWAVWGVLSAILLVGQVSGAWQSPLSEAEISQATGIALTDSRARHTSSRTVRSASVNATDNDAVHPLGVQVLLTELVEVKNVSAGDSRRVEVFLFNYQQGTTQLKVIDVEHGAVVDSKLVGSVHLPLTDAEIQYARTLMLEHTELEGRVKTELVSLYNDSHTELAALDARISIWVPGRNQSALANCDVERCALVSLFTANDESLAVEPVVNLSSGSVSIDVIQ